MGRTKLRVRAQRKFAQGAYVPPQNHPSTSGANLGTSHVSHRAVSAPGPVTLNGCSARDLLTRMSLSKTHYHKLQPFVRLEYDYGTTNTDTLKRKPIERRNSRNQSKRKYILRNLRKNPSNVPNARRVSVSDSGEDTPLSYLLGSRDTSPTNTNGAIAITATSDESVTDMNATLQPLPVVEESNVEDSNTSIVHRRKPSTIIQDTISLVRCLKSCSIPIQEKMLLPNSQTRTAKQSKNGEPSLAANARPPLRAKPSSSYEHLTLLRPKSNKSEPSFSKHASRKDCSSVREERVELADLDISNKRVTLRRTTKSYQIEEYDSLSGTSSPSTFKRDSHNDPDYEGSINGSLSSTDMSYLSKKKFKALKRKALLKERMRNKKKTESIKRIGSDTKSGRKTTITSTIVSEVDSFSTSASRFHGINIPDHNQPALVTYQGEADTKTLKWIRMHYPVNDNGSNLILGYSDATASEIVDTDIGNGLAPNISVIPTTTNDCFFKMPELPARFTKRSKNCQSRSCHDLIELLNTQSDSFCRMCQRCELINMFNKVSKQLPVSENDEPDNLFEPHQDRKLNCEEESIKYLRRGRELVRNVLTTKRLPIWLSNFEMNLRKTMFHTEHKLGKLKRTIVFPLDDVKDTTVSKVLTRIDYLARCIAEDNMELSERKSKTRSRLLKRPHSSTDAGGINGMMPLMTNTRMHQNQLNLASEFVKPTTSTLGTSAETAVKDSRLLVVRLTPLEEDPLLSINVSSATAAQTSDIRGFRNEEQFEPPIDDQPTVEDDVNSDSTEFSENSTSKTGFTSGYVKKCGELDSLVFKPTMEEFQDPITYIKKIEATASKYGICKIIPPAEFDIPCHLDENSMFTTINQYLSRLYQRWGPNSSEMTSLQTCVAMLANPRERDQFTKAPMFDGIELDLVKLYHLVLEHGGIEELLAHSEKWARIAEQMSLVSPRGKPDPKKLEKLYCKHVLPYESLSQYDRKIIREKVEKVWGMRSRAMFRRSQRPLHYQERLLGDTISEDEEETPLDADEEDVFTVGKPCFDRIEECTAKGRLMNLTTFRRIAAQIQAMRFPNEAKPSTLDVEEEYWRILNLCQEHVCVLSAFIDTSVDNLGHQSDPDAPGGNHPWNLKRLSDNPLNILRSLGKTLSVTVPTLCLNQLFSTNCWHMDPHKLAWMDCMHEGATKIWYAVPQSAAAEFRRSMETLLPSAVQNKGIWLTSDTTMIPPGNLMSCGVPVQRLEQNPKEFIVVFPGAYACSIATGLTISESIYFESKLWLNSIDQIFQTMRKDCEPAMFSSTLLLMRMARDPELCDDVLQRVYSSMNVVLEGEFDGRREAVKMKCRILLDQSNRADREQAISWPNQEECSICRTPLILSKVSRYNNPRSLMCLTHGLRLLSQVPVAQRPDSLPVTLLYSNEELKALIIALETRISNISPPWTKDRLFCK